MSATTRHLLTLAALLSVHCSDRLAGGAGAGNPPLAVVAVAFKAGSVADTALPKSRALAKPAVIVIRNPDGTFTIRDSAGSAVTLTAINVMVSRVEFFLPESLDCGDAKGTDCENREVSVRGDFTMDLMTGKSTPAEIRLKVPAGLYTQLGLELRELEGKSAQGEGASDSSAPNLVITGRADSAAGVAARPFTVSLNLHEGLDFERPEGLNITADSVNSILMRLAVDDWLKGVDFGKCLDTTAVMPDSSGVRNLAGDGFCGGTGLRLRRNIEASGEIEKGEGEHSH